MFSSHRDEPTTIDLHGAKSIDFTTPESPLVHEQLRQSELVFLKRQTIISAALSAFFLVFGIIFFRVLRHNDFLLYWPAIGVIAAMASYRRWRTLKSQTPPHQP